MKSPQEIQEIIKDVISNELSADRSKLNANQSFLDLGLDSLDSIFLLSKMEERLDIHIDSMSVYDYPTIQSFSEFLASKMS